MSSPIANPTPIVNTINGLSKESLSIDNGVATAKRDAAAFAENYGNHFQMVAELKVSTAQFSDVSMLGCLSDRCCALGTDNR